LTRSTATGQGHGNLPSEEELLKTLEGHYHEDLLHRGDGIYSYLKLFAAICLAAPVAVFFSMIVISGFQPEEKLQPRSATPMGEPASSNSQQIDSLIGELEKSNSRIAAALATQTKALERIASRIPEATKGSVKSAQAGSAEGPKIIVVKVPVSEPFDLGYEKIKILQLCGVDLDDPISGPGKFAEMYNAEVVKEVIHSFDIILASSKNHKEVSAFIRGNALKGRKYSIEQLKKIK